MQDLGSLAALVLLGRAVDEQCLTLHWWELGQKFAWSPCSLHQGSIADRLKHNKSRGLWVLQDSVPWTGIRVHPSAPILTWYCDLIKTSASVALLCFCLRSLCLENILSLELLGLRGRILLGVQEEGWHFYLSAEEIVASCAVCE